MKITRGPGFDKFLMRAKDIIWLVGMLWALLKGINAVENRFTNLEAVIMAQNITLGNIQGRLKDLEEQLNRIEYPDRYPHRRRRED